MASRLAVARSRANQPDEPVDRVPQRIRRHRKAREDRFRKEALRSRPDNGPGSLLGDAAYHMAKGCGWDVMRKELRKPEPPTRRHSKPNPYYDVGQKLKHADGSEVVLPSADCATWKWWKNLDPQQRHAMYELAHEGEPPTGVVVLNMGLEIVNPAMVVEVW